MLSLTCLAVLAGLPVQDSAPATAGVPDRAELERRFEQALTGARLVGSFTLLGQPGVQEDSYTIRRVSKVDGDRWRFEAVIEYGEVDVPVAMVLPVLWAGDTPVISVDDFQVPMAGTYSARVLIHGDQYAGTWMGKGYGGQMFGRVVRGEGDEAEEHEDGHESGDGHGDGHGHGHGHEDGNGQGHGDGYGFEYGYGLEYAQGVEYGLGLGLGLGRGRGRGQGGAGDEGNWPSFRGEGGRGVADGYSTPVEWDVESGKNVAWRVGVPGLAHSSPVIWGDKLFVTSAVRVEGEQDLTVGLFGSISPIEDESPFGFLLFCVDKRTGEVLWERTAWEGVPAIKRHPKGSHAASSPAVNDEVVVAFFGTEGLYCYDHEGKLLWQKDFGVLDSGFYMVPDAQWGFSSSPVLYGDLVLVQCDVQDESFVAALRVSDGEEVWRTARDEVPTWSTPTVDVREGREQVICNGYKHIGAYDLRTGEEIWKLVGGGDIPVPTPIVSHDLIFITNSHGSSQPIYAIRATAEGTLSADADEDEHMAWSYPRHGNYMQTPIAYGEELYCCSDGGIVRCYDIATGELIYDERLGSGRTGFTSSAVAADGKLYFASEEGDVHVVRAGRDFDVLAVSSLGEECMATPAISEGVLYYRTRRNLTAIGDLPTR